MAIGAFPTARILLVRCKSFSERRRFLGSRDYYNQQPTAAEPAIEVTHGERVDHSQLSTMNTGS